MTILYLITKGNIRVESELGSKISDPASTENAPKPVFREIEIKVMENGSIMLDGVSVDSATSATLPELKSKLAFQKTKVHPEKLLIAITADEKAPYQRIAFVLKALSDAGVSDNVTFKDIDQQ